MQNSWVGGILCVPLHENFKVGDTFLYPSYATSRTPYIYLIIYGLVLAEL